jgi:hypothetical protein
MSNKSLILTNKELRLVAIRFASMRFFGVDNIEVVVDEHRNKTVIYVNVIPTCEVHPLILVSVLCGSLFDPGTRFPVTLSKKLLETQKQWFRFHRLSHRGIVCED